MGAVYKCEDLWKISCGQKKYSFGILAGDEIEFTWKSNHNVYMMKDKAAFDACTFDSSKLIGETSGVKHAVKGSVGDTHYFACQVTGHCKQGQKLAVTIGTTASLAVRVSGAKHVCICMGIY